MLLSLLGETDCSFAFFAAANTSAILLLNVNGIALDPELLQFWNKCLLLLWVCTRPSVIAMGVEVVDKDELVDDATLFIDEVVNFDDTPGFDKAEMIDFSLSTCFKLGGTMTFSGGSFNISIKVDCPDRYLSIELIDALFDPNAIPTFGLVTAILMEG